MKNIIVLLACLVIVLPAYAKKGGKGNKQKSLPPGLAKKVERGQELPPGWQKKIAVGEVLDAEIYKKASSVSEEEKRELPPSPAGAKLLKIENKIIRVMEATRTILDVFEVGKKAVQDVKDIAK